MTYDVVVIGGGPAGYVAAIKAAQLGGSVALVEKDVLGGTCLNRGCIPTKAYLENAGIIGTLKKASDRGIAISDASFTVDMAKTVKMKDRAVKRLTSGVAGLLKSHDIKVYHGVGRITRGKDVIVVGETLKAKSIILAGGSKAAKINIPGIQSPRVLTSDEILSLKEVPKHLAVIGGGVIGAELGTAFRSFGSDVIVIEMTDRLLPGMDEEVSKEITKSLKAAGIRVMTSKRLSEIIDTDGKLSLILQSGEVVEADKALLSVGRVPDIEGIGEIELALDRGKIKVDDRMETSVKGIFAPGDVNGIKMLAHAAFKMGEVAAMNAMGRDVKADLKNVPSCVYTFPEAASVGLTEAEALATHRIKVGRFPFMANGRALAAGETAGFVKVIADEKYGEILGVHIVGPGAAEMINEAAALMEMEITSEEISEIVHAHPTFSEAFMEAAADSLGKAIHLPKR